MTTVILGNQLGRLKPVLNSTSGPLRYLRLMETQESLRVCDYLRRRPNTRELSRDLLFRESSGDFRKKYIEFMARVNTRNGSLDWWAMPFTNKNPLASPLCRNVSYFLLVAELLGHSTEPLLVVTDSSDLAAQIKAWAKGASVKAVDRIRAPGVFRRFLKRYTPAGIVKAFLRTLLYWALSRRYRPQSNPRDHHLLITTLTHPRSFSAPPDYRDAYFGALVEHLATSGQRALILGLVLERAMEQFSRLRRLKFSVPVVPLEACLPLRSLPACAWWALRLYAQPIKLRGPVEIDGLDLSCLVTHAIRDARHSGDLFLNLRVYCCARWLARTLQVSRCLYPYENRAWEKMLLLGVRDASPRTQIVGYQHASLTLSHTNFILGSGEAEITPLPDLILTTGRIVKEWLEKEGNYPSGIFKEACALRQGQPTQDRMKNHPRTTTRVLAALATSLNEYLATLAFLEEAFAGVDRYQVRVRPHPEIPLESAVAIAPLARRNFYSPSTGSLADDLQWADVVLYASSTVALEAVSLGIPAIYLDLGEFLDTDPMFGWSEFRWSVKKPAELVGILRGIEALPDHKYRELQQKGQEYVAAYLTPVTANGLRAFWET